MDEQLVHDPAPEYEEYVPAGHDVHDDPEEVVEYVPAWHMEQPPVELV